MSFISDISASYDLPVASDSRLLGNDLARANAPTGSADIEILRAPQFSGEDWLVHGFSTRWREGFSTRWGGAGRSGEASPARSELNLGYGSSNDPETVLLNRRRFLGGVLRNEPAAEPACGMVTLKQMHSRLLRRVGRAEVAARASLWGDGLATDEPGVVLCIQTADCLPVLIADRSRRVVAAFHAGWRGTLKGIVDGGIRSMGREFGSRPEELIAAIGPGIGACCFAVGAEVRNAFRARYAYADELFQTGEALRLDLVEANRRQLLAAGVPAKAIFALNQCTSCRTDRFFSYRAEGGKTGRLMAAIGIAPA